jgi:hypothetical protein
MICIDGCGKYIDMGIYLIPDMSIRAGLIGKLYKSGGILL